MGFLVRLLVSAFALWVASAIVSGFDIDGLGTLLLTALVLGFVNAIIRPILVILTLPITLLTLGLFLLVVNAATLGLTAWLIPGFSISGFLPALVGVIVISVASTIASWFVGGVRGKHQD